MTKKLDTIGNDETPTQKNGKRKAFIAFVLDESGSMNTGREATITGMNEQIQQIRETFKDSQDVEPIVTFVKFNGNVNPLYVNKTLAELKDFGPNDYSPNGMTAMYDGVGYVLNALENADGINDEDTSVLVVVISDGVENSSVEHNAQTIADRVKAFNDTKRWTFTYLGSNVDLTQVRAQTGFVAGNSISYDSSSAGGYAQAFNTHNASFRTYLSTRNVSASVLRASAGLGEVNFYAPTTNSATVASTDAILDNKTDAKA